MPEVGATVRVPAVNTQYPDVQRKVTTHSDDRNGLAAMQLLWK